VKDYCTSVPKFWLELDLQKNGQIFDMQELGLKSGTSLNIDKYVKYHSLLIINSLFLTCKQPQSSAMRNTNG